MSPPGKARSCLVALTALALLGACGPELQDTGLPEWDAAEWRSELAIHMAGLEDLIPYLVELGGGTVEEERGDSLELVRERLAAAEESTPRTPYEADLVDSDLSFRYREAVRQLRYGVESLQSSVQSGQPDATDRARRTIRNGLRRFEEVRERFEEITRPQIPEEPEPPGPAGPNVPG